MADPRLPGPPRRVQRRRDPGWRKPPGVIYVGRPTIWGNPHAVGDLWPGATVAEDARRVTTNAEAVRAFTDYLTMRPWLQARAWEQLAGHDLMCWCDLTEPCHADVWLRVANTPPVPDPMIGVGARPGARKTRSAP